MKDIMKIQLTPYQLKSAEAFRSKGTVRVQKYSVSYLGAMT